MTESPVDLDELIADGRLRPQPPDAVALRAMLAAARADVAASRIVRRASPSWSETMLYEAGLRASRVIVQAHGFRIAAERGHVTAIDAADGLTDGRMHRRFVRLHRMRRTRHVFMYEVGRDPSGTDLDQARVDVEALLLLAEEVLETVSG